MSALSIQLYSARDAGPWAGVLPRLADLGFAHVEGFGPLYDDPAETARLLRQTGLSMPTAHIALADLERDLPAQIALARTLGITMIFAPWLAPGDRPAKARGWAVLAARLALIGDALAAAGIRFGWHNHDFEMIPLASGESPMEILLDQAPGLLWEADLAWVHRAGVDPRPWIDRYGPRIAAVHVKDVAGPGGDPAQGGWADLGEGRIDWPDLLRQLHGHGVTRFVLEHDQPGDAMRFARRSRAAFLRMTGDG